MPEKIENEFKQVNPDLSELLRYHINVTSKADAETEKKVHLKALAALNEPAVISVHQHAAISHNEQQTPENPNNANAARMANVATAKDVVEDNRFTAISNKEQEKQRKAMEKQLKSASGRKEDAPSIPPALTPIASSEPVTSEQQPAANVPTPSIPSWKP